MTPPPPAPTDVDILNFALNLEYLEAEFYLRAATGNGLAAADIGANAGAVTGGSLVALTDPNQQNILNEIAYDEQQHVRFLRAAITGAGGVAVDRPAIDLTFFGPLATVAGITKSTDPAFNPFTSGFDGFLVGSFVFEDVGVTAYHGAAGLISDPGYLSAAAGIMAVEAYHAAYVRTALTARAILATKGGVPASTAYPYLGYANQVSALRGTLGGGNETPLLLPISVSTPSSIVAADATNAIAFSRTTDQVLHIVYGALSPTAGATASAAGLTKGGFFPNGLNGKITATAS